MTSADDGQSSPRPLSGIRVVEAALGLSVVGAGMASSVPGALLRDLGADVTRVEAGTRSSLDVGVEYSRVWNHGKELIRADENAAARVVQDLARGADALLLAGDSALIEQQGLVYRDLAAVNAGLVVTRVRPSVSALGVMPDLDLLVSARTGLCTQIPGHRPGRPVFPDANLAQVGAALSATVGALAGLYEREATGLGRWSETSLFDGLLAMIPMVVGRVQNHSPATLMHWKNQGPTEALVYRCRDGGYVQLWFGAKGAFEEFLEFIGDTPSECGYNTEIMGGGLAERGVRWTAMFATRDRAWWLAELSGHRFRIEPAMRPGEILLDPHVREVGLSVDIEDLERGQLTLCGPVATVTPTGPIGGQARVVGDAPLLAGVRVLDLSAYLAGPVGSAVLADLGADVVKVEPLTGDAHRAIEPLFAAGQRRKRAMAINLKAPDSRRVLARLFQWADVVHHNSRLGLAERLGYDEATVRAANPDVIYSFASGFGPTGSRANLPANDQLIQALAGLETAQGGFDAEPTFLSWGAVDVAGGWVSACGMLAALYARRRRRTGQSVSTSLLGAGMLLKSGAFVAGEIVVEGPVLDAEQLGYGAAYRLYEGSDEHWLALAITTQAEWETLRALIDGLPDKPPPLRTAGGGRQPEESTLEAAFRSKPAAEWARRLHAKGVPVELVPEADRTDFIGRILDDPMHHQLGRVVAYQLGERGRVEQTKFPPRLGPGSLRRARARIPGLGEHTAQVLDEVGFSLDERDQLAEAGVISADTSLSVKKQSG